MNRMLLSSLLVLILLSGCKPKGERLFEEGSRKYGNPETKEEAVGLLRQSGELGFAKAYAFLMENMICDAREAEGIVTGNASPEKKGETIDKALALLDRAGKYYDMAVNAGWVDEKSLRKNELGELVRKGESVLNIVRAESELAQIRELELSQAADPGERLENKKRILAKYVAVKGLYDGALGYGDRSVTNAIAKVDAAIGALGIEIAGLEKRKYADDSVIEVKKSLLEASRKADDKTVSEENLAAITNCISRLDKAQSICFRLSSEGGFNPEDYAKEIEGKKAVLERIAREIVAQLGKTRKEEALAASASYCIDNGVALTKAAIDEVVAALHFPEGAGDRNRDRKGDAAKYLKFKGRIATVEGKIVKVNTGWLGGVNIWIKVHDKRVKCGFPAMKSAEVGKYLNGQSIRVQGTIDGTGDANDDLSIANCKLM